MRDIIQIAKQGLNDLKKHVIGIFYINGKFDLIISHTDDTVDTLHISDFGIIQECYNMPKKYGRMILFENGKTMDEVLRNPFEWAEYVEQFYTK
jgi:hypothetical protein